MNSLLAVLRYHSASILDRTEYTCLLKEDCGQDPVLSASEDQQGDMALEQAAAGAMEFPGGFLESLYNFLFLEGGL